jgi:PTH1 family peptidyl-tRNA hydrolase
VVGLGNPGSEYAGSLHNAGADAVELVAQRAGISLRSEKGVQGRIGQVQLGDKAVALAVPTTYMNESGSAVRTLVKRFGIEEPDTLLVVHDELDLPPGTVRIKVGGGLAGHNGLRSIQAHLHTSDFLRIRIGVGKPPSAAQGADHVLSRPPPAVRELLATSVQSAAEAVERIARDGLESAIQWCHAPT